jgi:(p)ppGpp synthase/HD superfamily hydrolase
MIFKAIEFATRAHSGDYRKGTRIPYITHPLNVAKILIALECPEHIVAAGILHDTLEDTRVTFEEIKESFGSEVADLVGAVSEPNKSDHTWENRKAHTLKRLKTASPEVLLISLADKLDNITAIREDFERIGDKVWERFRRPKDRQQWYYEALAEIFPLRLNDGKAAALVHAYKKEVNLVFKRKESRHEV